MSRPIVVEGLDCQKASCDVVRASALVDGEELWFESGHALEAAPEAFLSSMLLPAMVSGRNLKCDVPVDETWLRNAAKLQDIFHQWWGHKVIKIEAPEALAKPAVSDKSCLFFTAGVDSFHNLLRGKLTADTLLYVEGLDVAVNATHQRESIRRHIRKVSEELGVEMLSLTTNLRQHHLFKPCSYIQTHGAALAACAHVLQRHLGRIFISASSVADYDVPFGSHWDTDPLWSSSRIQVQHCGNELWRADKLVEIAEEAIVRNNLRVCFNKLHGGRLNCGRCEKCVRTMLALHQSGQLEHFPTLRPPVSLEASIRRVSSVKDVSVPVYETYESREQDFAIRRALQQLIRRNRGPLRKWKRTIHKRWWQLRS